MFEDKNTLRKDKVNIQSHCACDRVLSIHSTSNFMHPLISSLLKDILALNCLFLPMSNYALDVKFLRNFANIVRYYPILTKRYTKL